MKLYFSPSNANEAGGTLPDFTAMFALGQTWPTKIEGIFLLDNVLKNQGPTWITTVLAPFIAATSLPVTLISAIATGRQCKSGAIQAAGIANDIATLQQLASAGISVTTIQMESTLSRVDGLCSIYTPGVSLAPRIADMQWYIGQIQATFPSMTFALIDASYAKGEAWRLSHLGVSDYSDLFNEVLAAVPLAYVQMDQGYESYADFGGPIADVTIEGAIEAQAYFRTKGFEPIIEVTSLAPVSNQDFHDKVIAQVQALPLSSSLMHISFRPFPTNEVPETTPFTETSNLIQIAAFTTPADTLPNPAGIYGLRLISSTYGGPLVNLRRSSDNTLQDFSPGVGGNFPTASAITFAAGSLLFVHTWYDQSGNGNDASEVTSRQPLFSTSVFDLNGNPAILFGDSTQAALSVTAAASINDVFANGGFLSAVVSQTDPLTQNSRIIDKSDTIVEVILGGPNRINLTIAVPGAGGVNNGAWTTFTSSVGANIIDITYSYANSINLPSFGFDGASENSLFLSQQPNGTVTSDAAVNMIIGNTLNRGFPGYIAELIICKAIPDSQTLTDLRAGQISYWQTPPLTTALPLDQLGQPIASAVINPGNAGSGYALNDFITLGNGTIIKVTSVSGSDAITSIVIVDGGDWTGQTLTNPVAQVLTTGSGTGAEFNLTKSLPQAAFGTILLTSAYTANKCLDLTRTSDSATTTLGFVNGIVDQAAGDAFAINDPFSCHVTKWYDQSGFGNDASQSTVINAPQWSSTKSVGGIRPVIFNTIRDPSGEETAETKLLTIGSLNWTPGNMTLSISGQGISEDPSTIFEDTGQVYSFRNILTVPAMTIDAPGNPVHLNTSFGASNNCWIPSTPAVCIWHWQDGLCTGYSNNTTGSTNALVAQTPVTGANIGDPSSVFGAIYDATSLVVFNRTSFAQMRRLNSPLQVAAGVLDFAAADTTIFVDGDSFSSGHGTLLNSTQYAIAMSSISETMVLINNAHTGRLLSQIVPVVTTELLPFASTFKGKTLIVILEAGLNDVRAGQTTAQIVENFYQYVSIARSSFPNTFVFLCTTPLQVDISGNQQWRGQFMDLILFLRNNWPQTGAAGLIDFFSDPIVGENNFLQSAMTNTLYSLDGGLHPTDLMVTILSKYVFGAINQFLLPAPNPNPFASFEDARKRAEGIRENAIKVATIKAQVLQADIVFYQTVIAAAIQFGVNPADFQEALDDLLNVPYLLA